MDTTETGVIGPECFASADESVICWKGVNYYRQPTTPGLPEAFWRGEGKRWHISAAGGFGHGWTLCGNYAQRRSERPIPEVDVCKSCLKALRSGREFRP